MSGLALISPSLSLALVLLFDMVTKEIRRREGEKQQRVIITIANICISRWDDGIHDEVLRLLDRERGGDKKEEKRSK